ncbi:hypothetical protein PHYBOEH_001796 [Phytophthora boehmeriae]|uniref:Uncharacterized protein n=1 Tax=Phytophthora boehmeriae TaxID=109152 RepID=A0A8T1WX21_9STRA|nr:hypothetical protein PHYBOEH_001796 [Phytophthora boehmeriae]
MIDGWDSGASDIGFPRLRLNRLVWLGDDSYIDDNNDGDDGDTECCRQPTSSCLWCEMPWIVNRRRALLAVRRRSSVAATAAEMSSSCCVALSHPIKSRIARRSTSFERARRVRGLNLLCLVFCLGVEATDSSVDDRVLSSSVLPTLLVLLRRCPRNHVLRVSLQGMTTVLGYSRLRSNRSIRE